MAGEVEGREGAYARYETAETKAVRLWFFMSSGREVNEI